MPHLDGTGPEGTGASSGRKLGRCSSASKKNPTTLGVGMGKRRKSGDGEVKGQGKRLKSGENINQ
ncbi:MAG: DUF5320 domain-containing protein [Paludibacter sp.]|nr:DUF5320 domain-containing protein [Paludibacter sp.]